MNKRLTLMWCIFCLAFPIIGLLVHSAIFKPSWEKLEEYQQNIKPEMIINIIPDDRYRGKLITDWKLEELALAMANAESGSPSHPMGYGTLTIEMNTTEIEIDSNVWFSLAYQGERFVVYFKLQRMRNEKPFSAVSFIGEGLNEWARNVGIADEEYW